MARQWQIYVMRKTQFGLEPAPHLLLGFYYMHWSYKGFDPYILDQPVRVPFVNGRNFPNRISYH